MQAKLFQAMHELDRGGDVPGEVTDLLARWHGGDAQALDRLLPLVYDELRARARRYAGRERGITLQPTEIVHEAFLRMAGARGVEFANRAHFLAIASRLMRQVLVDHARAKHAAKRGGDAVQVDLSSQEVGEGPRILDVLALDQVLTRLGRLDAEQERVVELRFFGGLTVEETAEALAISPATVKRSFASARAWLWRELAS
jgi:RNA polymerase sigma factor (TIGR02999 family)